MQTSDNIPATYNVLILDFDGVINDHGRSADGSFSVRRCVEALNRIITATDAKIVVCSMWRYLVHHGYMTVRGLETLLRTHGIQADVIDVTRPSSDEYIDGSGVSFYESDEPRWKQIADWLKRNAGKVRRYVIIDDDPDAFGGRPGVQTNAASGLTETDATNAIKILSE